MDELDLLTKLRTEVPLAAPSPRAEHLFRGGLADIQSSGRARVSRRAARRSRLRGRRGLLSPHVAVAIGLAAAVTAGILIVVLPSAQRPATVPPSQASPGAMSVQLLADLAAKAAQSGPSVQPGQWVYRKIRYYFDSGNPPITTDDTWTTADGTKQYVGDVADGEGTTDTPVKYSQLLSLPKDPAALDAYLAHLSYPNPDATQANKDVADFFTIEEMLDSYVLPPALTAELYHALADIPTVTAKTDVTDIDGRSGIAFVLPATPQSVTLEIIMSNTDYRMLAEAAWGNVGPAKQQAINGRSFNGPVLFNEMAILSEAFVSGPGVLPRQA